MLYKLYFLFHVLIIRVSSQFFNTAGSATATTVTTTTVATTTEVPPSFVTDLQEFFIFICKIRNDNNDLFRK